MYGVDIIHSAHKQRISTALSITLISPVLYIQEDLFNQIDDYSG